MSEEKPKVMKVEGLGEVTNPKPGVFKMTNKEADKFYEAQGIPAFRDVLKRLKEANSELVIQAVEKVLKPAALETKEDQMISIGTGNGRQDITLKNKVTQTIRNPQDKDAEPVIRDTYGVVRTKEFWDSPFKVGDKNERFKKLSEEIEKNFK